MDILVWVWLGWLLLMLFVLGSIVGSFLNVCIARLPLGLSLLHPGSRCGHCHVPIRMSDNVPLLSYWRLRGRCRHCGAVFSMRYFWVELLTGLGFVALYLLEVVLNIHRYVPFGETGWWYLEAGRFPPHSWPLYLFHLVMLCFLIVAVFCATEQGQVPRGVVALGLGAGLLGALLFPWPWPHTVREAIRAPDGPPSGPMAPRALAWARLPVFPGGPMDPVQGWATAGHAPRSGAYPWPVWGPPPAWLPPGSPRLGLATGLAGLLVAGGLMALFRLGWRAGDVAVSALAGSFLGWQPSALAVLLGVALAVVVAVIRLPWRRRPAPALAPWLAVGIAVAWLGWPWIGPCLYPTLFDPVRVAVLGLVLPAALVALGLLLRARRAGVSPARVAGETPALREGSTQTLPEAGDRLT